MLKKHDRPATIHEVARLAGVSHTTVSRYLVDPSKLKNKTRAKVESAVKDLDYTPNLLARSMRTRRTNKIGIVLPTGPAMPGRLLSAATEKAHEAGFDVEVICVDGGSTACAAKVEELANSGQVEGVLCVTTLPLPQASHWRAPVVVTGNYDDQLRSAGELAGAAEIRDIIEYLAGLGHRTFLHVAGDPRFASARNRRAVYLETIASLGLTSYAVVDGGSWSAQSGFDAITSLPDGHGVTAVVAASDVIAMGVVRGALSRGWAVPGELSVFGWDDEEMCRFATPSISTVAVDREAQGRDGITWLLAEINGLPKPPPTLRRLNRVLPRESVGPPPRPR